MAVVGGVVSHGDTGWSSTCSMWPQGLDKAVKWWWVGEPCISSLEGVVEVTSLPTPEGTDSCTTPVGYPHGGP